MPILGKVAATVATALIIAAAVLWSSYDTHRLTLLKLRNGGLVLLEASGIFLLLAVIVLLVVWLCQPDRITIREFENATGNANLAGSAITAALAGELQRITAIHAAQQDLELPASKGLPPTVLSSRDRLADSVLSPVDPKASAETIAAIGTVEFAGTSIPVGQVLVALRQLWPFRHSESVITGRLYRHEASLRLVVHLQRPGKMPPLEFSTFAPAEDFTHGFDRVIWVAAARIAQALSATDSSMSWWGFGHFTDALEKYQDYVLSRDPHILDAATVSVLQVSDKDRRIERVRALAYNLGIANLEQRRLTEAEDLFVCARRAEPRDAVAWNALGVTYFEQRRFKDARDAFSRATELEPVYSAGLFEVKAFAAQPWNGLGNTHVELAEYPGAINCYRKAISHNLLAAYPHNGLGNTYVQQELWEEAEKEYRSAIDKDPDYANPRHGLGNINAYLGKFDEALRWHREAIDLDTSLAPAWSGVGEAYAYLGRMNDALRAHRKAINLRPTDPSAYESLGETYLLQGEYQLAESEVLKALELDSGASYIWKTLGEVYQRMGVWNKADEAYGRAVELNPKNGRAWDGLAKVSKEKQKESGEKSPEETILYYHHAAMASPGEPFSWNQLGDAYYQAKDFKASIRAHSRARRLDRKRSRTNSYALDGIGKALLGLGQAQRAIRFHQAALQANPADAYALYGIGAALMSEGRYEDAVAASKDAAKLDPNSSYIWNSLGDGYERLRNYDDALFAYHTALELNACDAYAQCGIARVRLQKGQLGEALAACLRATELDRQAAFALTTLGDIHYRQGSYTEAVEEYRKALVRDRTIIEAWDGLGKAYLWIGDYANAAEAYVEEQDVRGGECRLALGRADVSFRKDVAAVFLRDPAGDAAVSLAATEERYKECVRNCPELALAAQVRLAVIAAWQGDTSNAAHYAASAHQAFPEAWNLRTHPDPDLLEFDALASLLQKDTQAALSKLSEATAQGGHGWRFDSERVGAYLLLAERGFEGFDCYQKQLGPQFSAESDAMLV
ncbi:MAG: tetratricopeptide repeat protein [Jatrophihabitantaceae bacterium]